MYRVIRIIVHAKSENEALKKAKRALHSLATEKKVFDQYKTLDDEEYWKEREDLRKDLLIAVLARHPQGVKLIEDGWQATVREFLSAFEVVKLAVQHLTPEEIMEGILPRNLSLDLKKKFPNPLIRYQFKVVGDQSAGAFTWLYYQDMPLTTRRDLDRVLKPKMGMEAYVVPADVHS
jgi:hypothetical protein